MKRFWLLIFLFVVACNNSAQPTVPVAQVVVETAVSTTPIPSPTHTAIPLPTNTPTITPTPTNTVPPTETPTPTQTPTPELPVGLGSAVPQPLPPLAPENASQIVELARYGDGELLEVQLSQDESTLYLIYSTGLYTMDVATGDMTKSVDALIPYNPRDPYTVRYTIASNGKYLALIKEPEIEVWDIASGHLIHTFSIGEIPYYFGDFAFAPDGQSLTITASLPSEQQMWLWRIADGELLLNQPAQEVDFWPNGNLLATYSYGTGLELRNTVDGTLVGTLAGPPSHDNPSGMVFSPDGDTLAVVYEYTIWLWDIARREPIQQLNLKNGINTYDLSFLQDGAVLSMYARDEESLRLWNVAEGTLITELPNQLSPVLSPDHTRLFTQSYGQGSSETILWRLNDVSSPMILWRLGEIYDTVNAEFVADGDFAFVGSRRSAQLLDSSDGSVVQTFDGDGERYGVALPDGDMFATISYSGLNFRDAENGDIRHTIEGEEYLLLPDSETIATRKGNLGSNLALWNMNDGTQLQKVSLPLSGLDHIVPNAFRPAGEQIPEPYIPVLHDAAYPSSQQYDSSDGLLSIRSNGSGIDVYDASTYSGEGVWNPDLLYTISFPQIEDLSFSPDNQLITAVSGNAISIWLAEDGSPVTTIPISSRPLDFEFSPDSRWIYTTNEGQNTGYISVWDIITGNKLFGDAYSLEFQNGETISYCFERPMAVSSAGDLVAYGSADCQIQIRQTSNWQVLQTIDPGFGRRGRMAFSPDGTLLATGFQGGEIKLWDTITGELVHTVLDHDSAITDEPAVQFAFSEDGQLLGTSANGILRLWGVWP